MEGFDEHVADRALQVGSCIVHRHRRQFMDGEFRAAQDEAHLRAIAVRDNDVPAGLDHVADLTHRDRHGFVLIRNRLVVLVADQRISSNRDHR